MKKERNPILVIACIFFLSLFIILPPAFRNMIPNDSSSSTANLNKKTNSKSNDATSQGIAILQCNQVFSEDLYRVSVNVKYLNSSIKSNTITYQKLDTLEEDNEKISETEESTEENKQSSSSSIIEEYNYLSQLQGIEQRGEDPNFIFVITEDTISNNTEDENLLLYFQNDISAQKSFYEEKGYICTINHA